MRIRSMIAAAVVSACFGASALAGNPMYDSWAKCKPGSSVTMTTASEVAGNKSDSETTTTLKSVTAEKVVVEIKTTMTMMGNKIESPATSMDIPATAAAPATPATPPAGGTPAAEAKVTQEKVTIAGKEYDATCTASKSDTNGMKMTSTVWTSPEVPGMTLKMVSEGEGAMKMSTKMEVTKIEMK